MHLRLSSLFLIIWALVPTLQAETSAVQSSVLSVKPTDPAKPGIFTVSRTGRTTPLCQINIAPDYRPSINPVWHPTKDDPAAQLTYQPGPDKDGKVKYDWHIGIWHGLSTKDGKFWYINQAFHPTIAHAPVAKGNVVTWEFTCLWRIDPDPPQLDANGVAIPPKKPAKPPVQPLTETQRWTMTDLGDTLIFDVEQHLLPFKDLEIPKADYGGFFIKIPWNGTPIGGLPDGTSTGPTMEPGKPGKPDKMTNNEGGFFDRVMRWYGKGDTQKMGITAILMDHPGNPGYPVPWRIQGNHWGPSRCITGPWTIPADKGEWTRNRYVFEADKPDAAWIESLFSQFAALPKAGTASHSTPTKPIK